MSSRTGSVNFFKKNYFQTFKIFKRHSTEYAVLAATTTGAQTRYPHRQGLEKLQHYDCRQPRGLELQFLWLSTTTITIKLRATVSDQKRLADPGEPDATGRAGLGPKCRVGRDPSTFLKKINFRLLKFSNGIRPSTQYSRRLRPVLKHGTPKRVRKVATFLVVDNHEYYQTEGNRLGPKAVSGPRGAGRDWESRSRTTCRVGRDPSTFLKKIFSDF
jgi:hypothetical protein